MKLTHQLVKDLEQVEFIQVPRSLNMKADEVARQASLEEFHTFAIQGSTSWTTPIISYLKDGHLPLDPNEARKI